MAGFETTCTQMPLRLPRMGWDEAALFQILILYPLNPFRILSTPRSKNIETR